MTPSDYKVRILHNLRPVYFGESYSVVTATEINADLIKLEYFLLVQLPVETMHQHAEDRSRKNSTADPLLEALDHAQKLVESKTKALYEERVRELNLGDFSHPDPCPFEYISAPLGLSGPWHRRIFRDEIQKILKQTYCPKLKNYVDGFLSLS